MFGNGCSHKFGPVQADGRQYCDKCGAAWAVNKPCDHKWKGLGNIVRGDKTLGFILQCEKCGDMKNHYIFKYLAEEE